MKYASLFAGIGGFDLALNRLGHECVYVNEWDKYAARIYEKNFGHKPDVRSITTVSADEIPDHDLLTGGFPCQAFSLAGKRRGFKDTRGTLFFDLARVLAAKRPTYFIFENVKGLLYHDSGRTFEIIMRSLDELGYDFQWQVCNSKYFVPQNRERIFIVGHIRGGPPPKIFPITGEIRKDIELSLTDEYSPKKFIKTRFLGQNGTLISDSVTLLTNEVPHIIDEKRLRSPEARGIIKKGYSGALETGQPQLVVMDNGRLKPRSDVNALDANYYKGLDNHRQRTAILTHSRNHKGEVTAYNEREVAGTLKGPSGNTQSYLKKDSRIRRLTPLECERLQGFPDNWTAGIPDTQRYKVLGNAVTVNVVYEIAQHLPRENALPRYPLSKNHIVNADKMV